jgi:putative membrane protein
MRWVYLVLFLVIVTIVVVFVVENNENTTVKLFHQSLTAPLSWFFVAVYLLGMWSGGTVVGFVKRAYHHATQPADQKPASQAR